MRAISLAPNPTDREPVKPGSGSDSVVGSARLFFDRAWNSGPDPVKTIQRMMPFLGRHGESRLTVGGIRRPEETVSAGAHAATTTPRVDAALEGATPRPIFMAMLFDLIKKRHV